MTTSYAADVDRLIAGLLDDPDPDGSVAMCIEAALKVYVMRHGEQATFNFIADIYDEQANRAVAEREKRMVELRKQFG